MIVAQFIAAAWCIIRIHPGSTRRMVTDYPTPPLDESPKRSLALPTDGSDTPLARTPIGLKSFYGGQHRSRLSTVGGLPRASWPCLKRPALQ